MLKKLLVILLLSISFESFSQIMQISKIDTVTTPYCRIRLETESVTTMLSNRKRIFAFVDFGFETKSKEDPLLELVDDNNKRIYFPSYVQILNIFYRKGWEVLQVREAASFGNNEFLLKNEAKYKKRP